MPREQPDILMIVLDTVRRDRLSAYGHPQPTTPAFDEFAADATLFERAVSPAQWTVPAHTSMFTGVYPSTHQVVQSDSVIPRHYPTLADILSTQGYHTAGFCNNPLVGVLDNDLKRGFIEFYNYAGAAPNRPQDMTRSRIRRMAATQWRRFAMRVSQSFAHSDWLFRQSLNPLFVPLWTRFVNYKGHTERSISDLIDYLAARQSMHPDQPNFTFLNLMGAHLPYRPPQDVLDRFAPEISRDKAAFEFMTRFNADAARWASPVDEPLNEFQRAVIDGFYNAEIAHQDAHLSRLFAYLKQSGRLDDTLVILVADHGEGHGDHDFFGHSFVVYQELVHVPLVIRYPASFPSGKRVKPNISTRRLFHTVLDLAGVNLPGAVEDVSGLSLVHALNGHPDPEKNLAFAEAIPPHAFLNVLEHRHPNLIQKLNLTQIRHGVYYDAYKLATVAGQVEGLFNLEHDPAEDQDISGGHQPQVAALQSHLSQFITRTQQARNDSSSVHLSDAMRDNLRALGYLD